MDQWYGTTSDMDTPVPSHADDKMAGVLFRFSSHG